MGKKKIPCVKWLLERLLDLNLEYCIICMWFADKQESCNNTILVLIMYKYYFKLVIVHVT